MVLKKQRFKDNEIPIFDDAVVYKRGHFWQFRVWLEKENKYIRRSLGVKDRESAIEKGREYYLETHANIKQGKTYFSITTKEAVDLYLAQRLKDIEAKLIGPTRYRTIKIYLNNWLAFVHKGTKIRELNRNSCENYFHHRTTSTELKSGKKTKRTKPIAQLTIVNEQACINAMMKFLYKQNETYIDGFDFKKLPRLDSGDDAIRRACFKPNEIGKVEAAIHQHAEAAKADLSNPENLIQYIICYYFLISMKSGLRTGEQRQLVWDDIDWTEYKDQSNEVSLVKIKVRKEISKVRKTRSFMFTDNGYLDDLRSLLWVAQKDMQIRKVMNKAKADNRDLTKDEQNEIAKIKESRIGDYLIFSHDGKTSISQNRLIRHFKLILDLANLEDVKKDKRILVPYSFRHYFITSRIMSGLSYRQISDMCGTSATQIENTYYHINEEIMRTNAMAGYRLSEGGLIEPEPHEPI